MTYCFLGRLLDSKPIEGLIHSLGESLGSPLSLVHTLTDTPRDSLTSLLGGSQFHQADEIRQNQSATQMFAAACMRPGF